MKQEDVILKQEYGKPCAIMNFSKLGYNYYRYYVNLNKEQDAEYLAEKLTMHPNVNWIITLKDDSADISDRYNFGVGILAKDSDLADVLSNVRTELVKYGKVVSLNQVANLWYFPNHPFKDDKFKVPLVQHGERANFKPENDIIAWDYLKIISLDAAKSEKEICDILGVSLTKLRDVKRELEQEGIVTGVQQRLNIKYNYYKVFVDTGTIKEGQKLKDFEEALFEDRNTIYVANIFSRYNMEVELYAKSIEEVEARFAAFEDVKIIPNMQFLLSKPFPVSNTANLLQMREELLKQRGKRVISLLNSKLWYLNVEATEHYLNISKQDKDYDKSMNEGQGIALKNAAGFVNATSKKQRYSVVDWGSGNGKVGKLLNSWLGVEKVKDYYPVDIQPTELITVVQEHGGMPYETKPTIVDFENIESRFPLTGKVDEQELHAFLGGTYGNFEIEEINKHMGKVLEKTGNRMIVTMPVFDISDETVRKEIIKSYAAVGVSNFIMGQLTQFGFTKEDFKENSIFSGAYTHPVIKNGGVVIRIILNRDVDLFDYTFKKGVEFEVSYSRKMSASEFNSALSKNFDIEYFSSDDKWAAAVISNKENKKVLTGGEADKLVEDYYKKLGTAQVNPKTEITKKFFA